MDMLAWLRCTKKKEQRLSIFQTTDKMVCSYSREPIYLGELTIISIPDYNLEVRISCSIRDGVCAKIKRLKPYKILYDYNDGGCILDDDKIDLGTQLKETLDDIRTSAEDCAIKQEKVEELIYNYILLYLNL